MTTSDAAPAAPVAQVPTWKPGKARGILAVIALVIAALLLPLAIVGFWGQRTLTDSERFVQTVGPLATQQAIQEDIATSVSESIVKGVNLESEISALLPPRAAPLAGPISSAAQQFVYTITLKLIQSPQFATFWTNSTERLQKLVIAALEGKQGGPVELQGDQIVLDTGDLIAAVKTELGEKGLTSLANRPTPAAADRQIVLLDAPQVKQARLIYSFSVPIATWLLPLVLLLFLSAVLLARRHARMVAWAGVCMILSALLIIFGLNFGNAAVTDAASSGPFARSAALFFSILTNYLQSAGYWTLLIGVLLLIGGWLFSGQKYAKGLRGAVTSAAGKSDGPPSAQPPAASAS
ncbi:MAG: hypothetical protein ACOYD0_05490 [Candidatus Nanopelagicales bacterium]